MGNTAQTPPFDDDDDRLFSSHAASSLEKLLLFCKTHLTRWTQCGNTSTPAFFAPTSKIRIFESGQPRQKRDLG